MQTGLEAEQQRSWTCNACTISNPTTLNTCGMCSTPRPDLVCVARAAYVEEMLFSTVAEPTSRTVIIGAGPVGLFFALQLKARCPDMGIIMLEKYAVYQRKHVLNIEAASYKSAIADLPSLAVPLQQLVGKVPTSKIETTFKQLALDLGVEIRTGVHVTSLHELKLSFPQAQYFIGADGRRSIMRQEGFDDCLCQDYNVMRMHSANMRLKGRPSLLAGWSTLNCLREMTVLTT